MNRILPLLPVFVLIAWALPASAQIVPPACDGDLTVIRVSQIKPTSSLAAFIKATEAHLAWYRKNGFTDNQIYTGRILVTDRAAKTAKYSDTEVMTFHVRPPAGASGTTVSSKDQAGWDAYVKQYRDSSDMKSEQAVCVPKNR